NDDQKAGDGGADRAGDEHGLLVAGNRAAEQDDAADPHTHQHDDCAVDDEAPAEYANVVSHDVDCTERVAESCGGGTCYAFGRFCSRVQKEACHRCVSSLPQPQWSAFSQAVWLTPR